MHSGRSEQQQQQIGAAAASMHATRLLPHLQLRGLPRWRVERAKGDDALGGLQPAVWPHIPRHAHCGRSSKARNATSRHLSPRRQQRRPMAVAGHLAACCPSCSCWQPASMAAATSFQAAHRLPPQLRCTQAQPTASCVAASGGGRRQVQARWHAPPSISSSSANSACSIMGAVPRLRRARGSGRKARARLAAYFRTIVHQARGLRAAGPLLVSGSRKNLRSLPLVPRPASQVPLPRCYPALLGLPRVCAA